MSPHLQQFYDEIGLWIDKGCPRHHSFSTSHGLCSAYNWWLFNKQLSPKHLSEFKRQFLIEFDDYITPFNLDISDYQAESNKYLNPKRLAWISKNRSA